MRKGEIWGKRFGRNWVKTEQGRLFEILADLTDKDGALAELVLYDPKRIKDHAILADSF